MAQPTDYLRLEDRGIRRNRPYSRKNVFRGFAPVHILLRFEAPAGLKLFEASRRGIQAFAPYQPLRLLACDPDDLCLKVSDAGESLKDLLAAGASAAEVQAMTMQIVKFLKSLPVSQSSLLNNHPYLQLFEGYFRKLAQPDALETELYRLIGLISAAKPLQGRTSIGILDPKLANFCRSPAGELSLVDFDHFVPAISQDLLLGFFLADLDCESHFRYSLVSSAQIIAQTNRYLFLEGMLARLVFEWIDPLVFAAGDPGHYRQMAQRLEFIAAQLAQSE